MTGSRPKGMTCRCANYGLHDWAFKTLQKPEITEPRPFKSEKAAVESQRTGSEMKFSQDEYLAYLNAIAERPSRELMLKYIQKSVDLAGLDELLGLELRGRYGGRSLRELSDVDLLDVWRWLQTCTAMFLQPVHEAGSNVINLSDRRK